FHLFAEGGCRMSLQRPLRCLALFLLPAACAALTAIAAQSSKPAQSAAPEGREKKKVEPARNPVALVLHDDGRKVVGSVSGTPEQAGQVVQVTVAGDKVEKHQVTLGADNTFTWPYTVSKPAKATFTVRARLDGSSTRLLEDSVRLAPPPADE